MFGKKFFSTVALSGAVVNFVGNVGSVFAEEFGPHEGNIVLTCKDDTVDYVADNDKNSYYYVNEKNKSWSLQDLVDFLRLDRSETEKLLYRMGHLPYWLYRAFGDPGLAQIGVELCGNSIWVKKRAKHDYFGSWVYRVTFNENCVDNMLKTDLGTIDFSHSRPKKTESKKTEPKKTEPKKTEPEKNIRKTLVDVLLKGFLLDILAR